LRSKAFIQQGSSMPQERQTNLLDQILASPYLTEEERALIASTHGRKDSSPTLLHPPMPQRPNGPFRFCALDVETANHDRGSICQIGLAYVRLDNSIETWVTYVNPRTSHWVFSGLHGITNQTVQTSPDIGSVLTALEHALAGITIYQHSGFDRSAIRAACEGLGRNEPNWSWANSVSVARRAWPELKGRGGHGLASLKSHLGLTFDHHDAGEDARAAAEVVLLAEQVTGKRV
jgi:DNA polymerase III subunit epsilon